MKYPNPVIPAYGGGEDCSQRLFTSPTVIHSGDYYIWANSDELCRGDAGMAGMVHSFSADKVAWSTPEFVSGPVSGGYQPSVIYRYGGLLKQMWLGRFPDIYYAEDSQLLNAYLPLSMR